MKRIDLHVHSNCSDGTLSPAALVQKASDARLAAFALTDHDSTDGLDAALLAASKSPDSPEIVPGIEFSTDDHGTDIHIVGLDIDYHNPQFQEQVLHFRSERLRRNQKMIDRMANDGITISYSQMAAEFGEQVWTRAHFARYLAEHGYVPQMSDAFLTHIGEGCPYFVPREKVSPIEVTRLIRRFGGIPVLAHPMQYHFNDTQLRSLLRELKAAGLIGMELLYSTHTPEETDYLSCLAAEFGLAASGGSDFHGDNKPQIQLGSGLGGLQIPYEVLENLRRANADKRARLK